MRNRKTFGKNKKLTGGSIAAAIVILLLIACFWVGEKAWERFVKSPEIVETTQPEQPQKPDIPITGAPDAPADYLALGNPSNASANTANADNYLMVNAAYALSYNNGKGTANWVAWRITESDFGAAERQNDFRPDPNLPKNFTRVTPADYTGSGYDRGHLCPSADRSGSPELNSATFFMTNMVPQAPELNRNVWERFESYSRNLVKRGKVDLYVVAGVYGEKGRLKNKVTVPTHCWKVVVAVPQGAGIAGVNENTHVIAVDMPNDKSIGNDDWRKYRTTVRAIEQKTNLNLLSNLPQNLQNSLENRVDNK